MDRIVGTILRVDLTSRKIEKEPLTETLRRDYIGGRGINSRILYDEVKPGIDALAPENRLIFAASALTGAPLSAGRVTATAKSPVTNIHGDANAGGFFGPELKFAGYDHIIFQGKADKPVYLWIENEHVVIRDAQHLWGKTTHETERMIKEELGDPRLQIACIGPGGENQVRFACIMANMYRAMGRTGMGAVMGSKNLKAVAVRGTKGIKVAHPETLMALASDLWQRTVKNPQYHSLSTYGSLQLTTLINEIGALSVRNARQTGEFDRVNEIDDITIAKNYIIRRRACFGCPIHCSGWYEVKEGPYTGEKGWGMEYGCVAAWGPQQDNSYIPSLIRANNLCDEYGLDVINCGEMVALAMDWYNLGLISKQDTEGIELKWGNYEAALEMGRKIAYREGFGDVLAEGPLRAAAKVGKGAEKCLSTAKGMLYSIDAFHYNRGFALNYATSTRGADHLRGMPKVSSAIFGEQKKFGSSSGGNSPDITSYKGKALPVQHYQRVCTIADAMEVCKYASEWVGLELGLKEMAELFSAITGIEMDESRLTDVADRIWTVERAFLIREGITRKDDAAVGRPRDEAQPSGPYKGIVHDQKGWDEMLDEYYELVGWDKETGVPTLSRLETLGLKDIAEELKKMGKL